MDQGQLVYEYNMMMIERYIGHSMRPCRRAGIGSGRTAIGKPGGPAEVAIAVDGKEELRIAVKRTVAGAFSASETLDVGIDLGSPVSSTISTAGRFGSTAGSKRSRSNCNNRRRFEMGRNTCFAEA